MHIYLFICAFLQPTILFHINALRGEGLTSNFSKCCKKRENYSLGSTSSVFDKLAQ